MKGMFRKDDYLCGAGRSIISWMILALYCMYNGLVGWTEEGCKIGQGLRIQPFLPLAISPATVMFKNTSFGSRRWYRTRIRVLYYYGCFDFVLGFYFLSYGNIEEHWMRALTTSDLLLLSSLLVHYSNTFVSSFALCFLRNGRDS